MIEYENESQNKDNYHHLFSFVSELQYKQRRKRSVTKKNQSYHTLSCVLIVSFCNYFSGAATNRELHPANSHE